MLNYSCKKVLNCLIKIKTKNIKFEGTQTLNKYLPKWIIKNIDEIIEYLSNNGYLIFRCADNDFYEIELTYKGLAYKSFYFEEIKDFIFKSVTIPILVSIFTSVITTCILKLL